MRVLIAPDSFGGTLGPAEAAAAIAAGWAAARPEDELVVLPLSDGGEGLLDALLAGPMADAGVHVADVADAAGIATDARWLLSADGATAVVESAEACGLARLRPDRRDPRRTTTWGVGQLLDAARAAGASQILVGLGGSATVDGGAGALSGLGFRLTVADGSGLKVGGEDLPRVTGATHGWAAAWDGLTVELLADVTTVLADAPRLFGPQKGADPDGVAHLEAGLAAWRAVAERDLGADRALAVAAGSGAAGGLGYGLAAGIGAVLRSGVAVVADLVGLDGQLAAADLVLTGEGALDATSASGKVVGWVAARARSAGTPVVAVVGQQREDGAGLGLDLALVEEASPDGPGADAYSRVVAAAHRAGAAWADDGR